MSVVRGTTEEADSQPVKIGVIIPLTGALAASAESFRAASLMALNDFGPDTKLRYKIIFEDDQLQSKYTATAVRKLIDQDKVSAVVSTWSYGGSVVAPIAERSRIIHIGVAWAPQIAAGRFNFLNLAPPSSFIPVILEILKRRNFKTITTVVPIEAGSVYSAQEFERLAPSTGLKVISKVEVAYSETDFRSTIARELSKKPDVLYVNLIGGQLDTFISQLRAVNSTVPVVIQTGLSTVESLAPYEGYWYAAETYFQDPALEQRLITSVRHHHTLYAANFYDAVRTLIQAFEQAATTSRIVPTPSYVLTQTKLLSTTTSIFPNATLDTDGVLRYSPRLFRIQGESSIPTTVNEILASSWGRL